MPAKISAFSSLKLHCSFLSEILSSSNLSEQILEKWYGSYATCSLSANLQLVTTESQPTEKTHMKQTQTSHILSP
jgi:hypothetical protein